MGLCIPLKTHQHPRRFILEISRSPCLLFSYSLPHSPNRHLFIFLLILTQTHTNTHYSYPHCPGSGSNIFFFLFISITSLACQLLASSKIIPIYPTRCLHKPFRLSDSLRGMTDSGFPLFKENWIHQPLLSGCFQAFHCAPSDTLVAVCGAFMHTFAHIHS